MENIKSDRVGQRPTKKCSVCKEDKKLADYHNTRASKDGKASRCKSCTAEAQWKYYRENDEAREKIKARERKRYHEEDEEAREKRKERARRNHIYKKYGLTIEQFDEMNADQNGKCAICGGVDTRGPSHKLSIDHCHTTGNIRGLLCNNCNRGLGLLGDTKEALEKALFYLTKNNHDKMRNKDDQQKS